MGSPRILYWVALSLRQQIFPTPPEVEEKKGWGEDRSVDSPTISTTLQALLANAVRSQTIVMSYSDNLSFYQFLWITTNWEVLKEMGIPDHLTCLLRNLYASQEATVKTGHGTTDWFQTGKGVCQGCILLPCLFNFYAGYIMRNTGLDEAQAGIKMLGDISITSDMQMTPPLWQKMKN